MNNNWIEINDVTKVLINKKTNQVIIQGHTNNKNHSCSIMDCNNNICNLLKLEYNNILDNGTYNKNTKHIINLNNILKLFIEIIFNKHKYVENNNYNTYKNKREELDKKWAILEQNNQINQFTNLCLNNKEIKKEYETIYKNEEEQENMPFYEFITTLISDQTEWIND